MNPDMTNSEGLSSICKEQIQFFLISCKRSLGGPSAESRAPNLYFERAPIKVIFELN